MNTIRSTWIGWATFTIAGGGAYYFAKKSVNADKKARHEEDLKRQRLKESLEEEFLSRPVHSKAHKKASSVDSSGLEATHVPAPMEHSAEASEASKYLPTKPYKAKKGDRFS